MKYHAVAVLVIVGGILWVRNHPVASSTASSGVGSVPTGWEVSTQQRPAEGSLPTRWGKLSEKASEKSATLQRAVLNPSLLKSQLNTWLTGLTNIDQRDQSAALIRELASDPVVVDGLSEALLDLTRTTERFGKDQAKLRVMAVAVLGERARQGDPGPLHTTIAGLVDIFEKNPGQKSNKGRAHDLVDLLAEWIQYQGKPKFVNDPRLLLAEFEFSEIHRREIAMAVQLTYPEHGQDQRFLNAFTVAWGQRIKGGRENQIELKRSDL